MPPDVILERLPITGYVLDFFARKTDWKQSLQSADISRVRPGVRAANVPFPPQSGLAFSMNPSDASDSSAVPVGRRPVDLGLGVPPVVQVRAAWALCRSHITFQERDLASIAVRRHRSGSPLLPSRPRADQSALTNS